MLGGGRDICMSLYVFHMQLPILTLKSTISVEYVYIFGTLRVKPIFMVLISTKNLLPSGFAVSQENLENNNKYSDSSENHIQALIFRRYTLPMGIGRQLLTPF